MNEYKDTLAWLDSGSDLRYRRAAELMRKLIALSQSATTSIAATPPSSKVPEGWRPMPWDASTFLDSVSAMGFPKGWEHVAEEAERIRELAAASPSSQEESK